MKNKFTVLIDVDGVLADFLGATISSLKPYHQYKRADFTDWDIIPNLKEEHRGLVREIWESRGWCFNIPAYPEAQNGVAALRRVAKVVFVTAPMYQSATWCYERAEWLKFYFKAKESEIVFTSAKHLVNGFVLIDDKPSNITSSNIHVPILWDQLYNRNVDVKIRASGNLKDRWKHVRALFTGESLD